MTKDQITKELQTMLASLQAISDLTREETLKTVLRMNIKRFENLKIGIEDHIEVADMALKMGGMKRTKLVQRCQKYEKIPES